jgi:hypothetical protein
VGDKGDDGFSPHPHLLPSSPYGRRRRWPSLLRPEGGDDGRRQRFGPRETSIFYAYALQLRRKAETQKKSLAVTTAAWSAKEPEAGLDR